MENLTQDSFDIHFNILQHVHLPDTRPPVLSSFPLFPYPHIVPCEELLRDIPGFLRTSLSNVMSDDEIQRMIPSFMSHVESRVEDYHSAVRGIASVTPPHLIPLFIEVQLSSSDEVLDHEEEDEDESMEEVIKIPASEEAIASLSEVKVMKDEIKEERCSICLENFEDNDYVLAMPCDHIFHKNCILEWLKISYKCPLCRYKMPIV